jgi:diguanylate cyclase (GGDEF)-like protein
MTLPSRHASGSPSPEIEDTVRAAAEFHLTTGAEAQYREAWLEQNIPRARISTAIYLALVLLVTAINSFGAAAPLPPETLNSIFALRIGVACPALLLILCATEWQVLRRRYQIVVGFAVTVVGVSVMTISALAAASGSPQLQMGDVLVVVYACLFLGLRQRTVVVVASILVVAFVAIGLYEGVPTNDLTFAGAVISATALMAVLSAGRLQNLARSNFIETRLLNERAERDGLTSLYNRRKFDEVTKALWEQARRDRQSLQIVLVDIDCFKLYNDLYGHQAGDDCIRIVADIVARAARRPRDFCARYGGEEFVLVLCGAPTDDPLAIPEQIRAEVERQRIPHKGSSVADCITVSAGSCVSSPESGRSLAGLIQRADEALYEAKREGRNRVAQKDGPATNTGAFKVLAG